MQEHVIRCDRNSINILLLAISLEPGMYLMNIVGNGVIKQVVQKSVETELNIEIVIGNVLINDQGFIYLEMKYSISLSVLLIGIFDAQYIQTIFVMIVIRDVVFRQKHASKKLPVFNIAHEGTSHDIDVRRKITSVNDVYLCTVAEYTQRKTTFILTKDND